MKAYIQVKQVGKRKCSIEKMPIDFPTPPASVQELIEAVVCWQVKEYNERLQQSEMLKYLTCEEMEDKAAAGKVGFEANYNADRLRKPKPSSTLAILRRRNLPHLSGRCGTRRIILLRPTERRIYTYLYPAGNAVRKTLVTAI